MKHLFRIFLLLLLASGRQALWAQNPLNVTSYTLPNGLTVFLNEDHTSSRVFGAVAVKAGSMNDPKDATGIAHYFEHIMFKGTDRIGTTDWQKEKVYLDSISDCYDRLGETADPAVRLQIQKKINSLSIAASDYAIPNEVDKLLKQTGGTGINAYTSYDRTVYLNSFPPDQLAKWIEIYAERFRNPVFRLFQSELETVYEEKNMYMDNPLSKFLETVLGKSFPGHPLGEWPVIGKIEHLKNPSLRKMHDFFQTYYVANNMALILSGDFSTAEALPLIRETFGAWPSRALPPEAVYNIPPFNGREVVNVRETPVKVGFMGFRTVPQNHPDRLALELCNSLLSNSASTGLLDKLRMDNRLMTAMSNSLSIKDAGLQMIIFVPKLVGQSLEKAEALIVTELNRLKQGDFDESLIDAIKLSKVKEFQRSLEEPFNRGNLLAQAFINGKTWDEVLKENEMFGSLTKEDVIRIANKYYSSNYLIIFSKMGFPKKEKLPKPPYDPVQPMNTEARSEFAKMLENQPDTFSIPRFIEFGKDVQFADIKPLQHFYYTLDPVNRIFEIKIKYGVGNNKYPVLNQAADYMELIGTENKSFREYRAALQKLGASVSFEISDGYLTVRVDGFDDKLDETLALVNELLTKPKADPKQMEKFIEEARINLKMEQKDPATLAEALREYGMYGPQSAYLNRLPIKKIRKLTGDSLLHAFRTASRYEAEIHYSGTLAFDQAREAILNGISLPDNPIASASPVSLPLNPCTENTLLFLDDRKAIQSKVYIIREGQVDDERRRILASAFDSYFGGDMSSLVFQEIREFRSLAYNAYARYVNPFDRRQKGYLKGFLSTQSDKTTEAMKTFFTLIDSMPVKPERLGEIKASLVQSVNTGNPNFRNRSAMVENWRKQGYQEDPRKASLEVWKALRFDDITDFYNSDIKGKPTLVTLNGDGKRFNVRDLQRYGKIIKVSKKQILTR